MTDILYTRGDTISIANRTIRIGGIVQNITGWEFALTVNSSHSPDDISGQQFQVTGTLTDAVNGVVDFYPTAEQTDLIGTFYFDIEAIDSSGYRRTWELGQIVFQQDISKSDEIFTWTPLDGPADGTPVAADGSVDVLASALGVVTEQYYETIDGRRVIRWPLPVGGYSVFQMAVDMRGPRILRPQWEGPGHEFITTVYIETALVYSTLQGGAVWLVVSPWVNTAAGPPIEAGFNTTLWNGVSMVSASAPAIDTTGWPSTGWYVIGQRINPDWSVETRMQPEADAEYWQTFDPGLTWFYGQHVCQLASIGMYSTPGGAGSIRKFEWRRL